jgi:hypothetical protein
MSTTLSQLSQHSHPPHVRTGLLDRTAWRVGVVLTGWASRPVPVVEPAALRRMAQRSLDVERLREQAAYQRHAADAFALYRTLR